jgi:hypothetical protein
MTRLVLLTALAVGCTQATAPATTGAIVVLSAPTGRATCVVASQGGRPQTKVFGQGPVSFVVTSTEVVLIRGGLGDANNCVALERPVELVRVSPVLGGARVATLAVGESACDDRADDDGDGFTDCADADCEGAPCSIPNASVCVVNRRCSNSVCQGGDQVMCPASTLPCLEALSCDTTLGCRVAPRSFCDDGDPDTQGDTCFADGGCAGRLCDCPPVECFSRQVGAGCTADNVCRRTPVPAGSPCDGGACTANGLCADVFTFTPANVELAAVPPPAGALRISCETTIQTADAGWLSTCDAGRPPMAVLRQSSDPNADILTVSATALEVTSGHELKVVGPRPLALIVFGAATVSGLITASNAPPRCSEGEGESTDDGLGTGGGGFGSPGASGGRWTAPLAQPGRDGGRSHGNTNLQPLTGGCSSGKRGQVFAAGGGAFQLSASGPVIINGIITAPGQGGAESALLSAAVGGGSGGGTLIEGESVRVSGFIAANGGGGGGTSAAGAPGLSSAMSAAGGAGLPTGGAGAAGTRPAEAGGEVIGPLNSGGGGGGVGRIFIRAQTSCVGASTRTSPRAVIAADGGCS